MMTKASTAVSISTTTSNFLLVVSFLLLLLVLPSTTCCCAALSLVSSSSFSARPITSTVKSGSNIKVRIAKLPTDLADIRDCRKSAYANKPINLPAAKSFVNADQVMKEGYICVIATNDANQQSGVVVLGTADLNTRTGVVNNVYVRNEARKCGVGRAMMQTVEEYYANNDNNTNNANNNNNNNNNNNANNKKKKKLKLTVMSNNIPAVTLYKSLGFTAPGIYSILDSMTVMTRGALDFLIQMEKEI